MIDWVADGYGLGRCRLGGHDKASAGTTHHHQHNVCMSNCTHRGRAANLWDKQMDRPNVSVLSSCCRSNRYWVKSAAAISKPSSRMPDRWSRARSSILFIAHHVAATLLKNILLLMLQHSASSISTAYWLAGGSTDVMDKWQQTANWG